MTDFDSANELTTEDHAALIGLARRRRADVVDVLSDGLLTMRVRVMPNRHVTKPLRLVKVRSNG